MQGCDRNQTLLLPNSVDDYIGPDNLARFVDAFVGQLDLQGAAFFRVEPTRGQPGMALRWRNGNFEKLGCSEPRTRRVSY